MPQPASTRLGLVGPTGNTDDIALGDNQINAIIAQLEAVGAAFQQGTSRPSASAALQGYFYIHTGTGVLSYCTGSVWLDFQPYDSDLAAIAALSTTTIGISLLAAVDAPALRTILGTIIGTDVQAHDSDLDSIAALSTASFGRSLLTVADAIALQRAAPLAVVSSLPASPVDGQECYYLADATNGVVWHLKYRAASGSTYKWEYIGGATLRAAVDTSETTTSASFTNLTTSGPTVTLPLAGDYDITWGARTYGNTAGVSYKVGPSLAGAGVGDYIDNFAAAVSGGASNGVNVIGDKRKTGRSAGDTVTLKYASNGTAVGTWDSRWVRAVPVRVG